jgi:DNA-binding SARP family transcriptional activator
VSPPGLSVGASVQLQPAGAQPFEASGNAALLLALLALEERVERKRVAQLLWPHSAESQARNNLRTLVHRLNQRFGAEFITGAERLELDAALARVQLADEATLLQALDSGGPAACELLGQAAVEEQDNEPLSEWLAAARQRWRRRLLAGLAAALEAALQSGLALRAQALARAAVQLEPLSEHLHRQLMDTLARCGDRAAALAAYEDCKAVLREHLGVQPDLQTRTVQLRLLQGQAQDQPAAAVAVGLAPLGGAARFALVEREDALAQLQAAREQAQHVALHGEAGAGKTRLLREWTSGQAQTEQVSIHPGSRAQSYSALAQLLQEVQPRRAVRIGLPEQVELARLAPLAFADVQPSQAALSAPRLHAALRHWLERLHRAGLQQLVIDDLHYADAESQAALAALLGPAVQEQAQALPTLPRLLLAHRSGEIEAGLAEALVSAQLGARLRMLALPRLSPQGVRTLLHAMQTQHSEALAAQLYQRTGGNPLFVIELAQQAQERAQASASASADNLQTLLRTRLGACTLAAQQLAAVAAVAAHDFSVELAVAVTGLSALALMPAWSELQQRGLFADHGLAHELVREAVLATLPKAIARTLYRQVALHLEQQGLKGAAVLAHWLAAEDFDRALPHAVQQLDDATVAGVNTQPIELELLALMLRLSDPVLLANLWLSAGVNAEDYQMVLPTLVRRSLQALVERVSTLANSDAAAAWLAYERARLLDSSEGVTKRAYDMLYAAAPLAGEATAERVRFEIAMTQLSIMTVGSSLGHMARARAIAAGLPEGPAKSRLSKQVQQLGSYNASEAIVTLRSQSAALRSARRRHDLAAVAAIKRQIFATSFARGLSLTKWRFSRLPSWSSASLNSSGLPLMNPALIDDFASAATCLGRFGTALAWGERSTTADFSVRNEIMSRLRLGQWEHARSLLAQTACDTPTASLVGIGFFVSVSPLLYAHDGVDPVPHLRRLTAMGRDRGLDGVRLKLWEWEYVRLGPGPQERMVTGASLVQELRQAPLQMRLPRILVDVAEAHAQAGSPGFRPLALEAARELRRGRGSLYDYLPENLVRCARLLQDSDPGVADASMHVARRFAQQSLDDVPADARETFIDEVPVNRLLLGGV